MSQLVQYQFDHSLYSFTLDGWFNATEAAAKFGKEPFDWLIQRDTVGYLVALAEHIAERTGEINSGFVQELNKIKVLPSASAVSRTKLLRLAKKTALVKTRTGAPDTGGGTWLHPKLAVAFARWLDVHFGVWCDEQIDTILRGQIQARGNPDLIGLYLRPDAAPWEKRFPDDYTRIAWRGKPADQCPDGPRYRVLGNSMAVPVMRWIGQRIDAATHADPNESSTMEQAA